VKLYSVRTAQRATAYTVQSKGAHTATAAARVVTESSTAALHTHAMRISMYICTTCVPLAAA
jgi:hypothetical protein